MRWTSWRRAWSRRASGDAAHTKGVALRDPQAVGALGQAAQQRVALRMPLARCAAYSGRNSVARFSGAAYFCRRSTAQEASNSLRGTPDCLTIESRVPVFNSACAGTGTVTVEAVRRRCITTWLPRCLT